MFICSASSPGLCIPQKGLLETIRGTSTVPPCGYSVNIRGNQSPTSKPFGKQIREKKIKPKQERQTIDGFAWENGGLASLVSSHWWETVQPATWKTSLTFPGAVQCPGSGVPATYREGAHKNPSPTPFSLTMKGVKVNWVTVLIGFLINLTETRIMKECKLRMPGEQGSGPRGLCFSSCPDFPQWRL